jgi:hypothetical protein
MLQGIGYRVLTRDLRAARHARTATAPARQHRLRHDIVPWYTLSAFA